MFSSVYLRVLSGFRVWLAVNNMSTSDILTVAEGASLAPEKFQVGLVQMSATPDPAENLQRAMDFVRQAAARGAQIVCLPELFQTQYFCQREDAALFDLAEPIPGPATEKLQPSSPRNWALCWSPPCLRNGPRVCITIRQ